MPRTRCVVLTFIPRGRSTKPGRDTNTMRPHPSYTRTTCWRRYHPDVLKTRAASTEHIKCWNCRYFHAGPPVGGVFFFKNLCSWAGTCCPENPCLYAASLWTNSWNMTDMSLDSFEIKKHNVQVLVVFCHMAQASMSNIFAHLLPCFTQFLDSKGLFTYTVCSNFSGS